MEVKHQQNYNETTAMLRITSITMCVLIKYNDAYF